MQIALHQTFAAAGSALAAMSADQARAGRLGDAWRENLRRLDDHERFIKLHLRTVADRAERTARDVAYAEQKLADRFPKYLACVRRVTEFEAAMDSLGIAYAKSSHAWPVEACSMARAA